MRLSRCSTLLLAVTLAVLAAGPAQAASRLVVRGAGFGHGVGMSQYGAYGFATRGKDHAFILRHYYRGTRLGSLDGSAQARVLLKRTGKVVFSGTTGVAGGRTLDPARTYNATRALGGAVTLRSASGRDLATYRSPLTITGGAGGFRLGGEAENGISDGRYRGNLQISAPAIGELAAINALGLEDYVRGVVAGEVPSTWPDEALRAQAVTARTYALATRRGGEDGFDQYADTRSQVYKGVAGEQASTDAAVAATAGEVVVFEGKPIVTYYFSTSGGRTENVENSFLGAEPKPYLTSVEDPFDDASPRHRWVRRLSLRSAGRRLGSLLKGSLVRIRVLRRGRSPRVVRAEVVGTRGRTRVSGPQLRSKLGLYDTWARFTVITARARRGDGNSPKSSSDPGETTGGARPRFARAAATAAAGPVIGAVTGRIAPAGPERWLVLERRIGGRWVEQFEARLGAGGRYRATVRRAGLWRVRYAGEPGPAVLVRASR